MKEGSQLNNFFSRVYEIVAKIPPGKVATYGQIAFLLGEPHNGRVVGWAMKAAPSDKNLPCHRVVNRLGELSPSYVFGGYDVQRKLLESEGVTFRKDGRINMKEHMWSGEV